jgi:hypothetical protein
LADILSAFMQERNIRWGELVSGLLIVGSAAGLVLSLRDQLREWIPFFPAFLFLLGTAAIHGAGLYTLRRWNLASTSRGVLTISLLLVPLNFLAAILISGDEAQRLSRSPSRALARSSAMRGRRSRSRSLARRRRSLPSTACSSPTNLSAPMLR